MVVAILLSVSGLFTPPSLPPAEAGTVLVAAASPTPTPKPTPSPKDTGPAKAKSSSKASVSAKAPAAPSRSSDRHEAKTTVGLKFGGGMPAGSLAMAPGLAIDLRRTLALGGKLGAGLEVGYSRTISSGSGGAGPFPTDLRYDVGVTTIPVVVSGFWRQPVGGFSAYGSGGLVLAQVEATTEAGGGTNSESGLGSGFDLTAGAEIPLGPGLALAEVGYRHLTGPSEITGKGNLAGPGFRIGYRLAF